MSPIAKLFQGRRKLFWLLAGPVLAADQATKLLLWAHPDQGRPDIVLIPGLLRIISHPGNTRMALGLGPSAPWFYVGLGLAALAVVAVLFVKATPGHALPHCALGMLAGGAVGNLMDRLFLGVVRDFIDLHLAEAFHWHTFNVADAAICVGFVLVVYDAFFGHLAAEGATDQEDAHTAP